MTRTIYIDCSYLCEHTHLNTGIQRVVRRVVESLDELAEEYEVRIQPVRISMGRFDPLTPADLHPRDTAQGNVEKKITRESIYNYVRDVYIAGRELVSALLGHNRRIRAFLYAPRDQFGLGFIINRVISGPLRVIFSRNKNRAEAAPLGGAYATVKAGDILLLLDSTWHSTVWPSVAEIRRRGARVVSVVYDLIPISHPQFCDDVVARVFRQWLQDSVQHVDGYMAISATVRNELEDFLVNNYGVRARKKSFDYFLLGADFRHAGRGGQSIRPELAASLTRAPTYLVVSTVEPRKNHAYLLDAFEQVWNLHGKDVNLFIVGRMGWKVGSIKDRILSSDKFGRKLFHWPDLNDEELYYCYKNCKMLVFPSIVEGFGLPIIESLGNGLPVLASDTPIHREIGGEHIGYFDLADPSDLARRVVAIETVGIPPELHVSTDRGWLGWRESCEILLRKLLGTVDATPAGQGGRVTEPVTTPVPHKPGS